MKTCSSTVACAMETYRIAVAGEFGKPTVKTGEIDLLCSDKAP
jgi:hypothetical protein